MIAQSVDDLGERISGNIFAKFTSIITVNFSYVVFSKFILFVDIISTSVSNHLKTDEFVQYFTHFENASKLMSESQKLVDEIYINWQSFTQSCTGLSHKEEEAVKLWRKFDTILCPESGYLDCDQLTPVFVLQDQRLGNVSIQVKF